MAWNRDLSNMELGQWYGMTVGYVPYLVLASFPGLVHSSLAVRNSRRRPGPFHHVMHAAAYVTTILLESMMS